MDSIYSPQGLFYLIATSSPDSREAVGIAQRLEALVPAGTAFDRGEASGVLWGIAAGRPGPGDRTDRAREGPRECILRGDPVWMEPVSPAPCTARSLLEKFEREGMRAFALLDNLYLAVLIDRSTGEVLIATDLVGGIRLYSTRIGSCTLFATSYLLTSKLDPDLSPDFDSISAFLHLGYFLGERTALRSVRVHPAGTVTRVQQGSVEIVERWKPDFQVPPPQDLERSLDEAVDAFNASVRESVASFERSWLALTAGLDSRCILSSLIRQRVPHETYTHGFPGCWEQRRVERIVRRHGIRHRFVPLASEFVDRLEELALASYRATEGEISSIEKSHLLYVLSALESELPGERTSLLLGGGAGHLKGTFYRLLKEEPSYTERSVDRYIAWNLFKRLPGIFARELQVQDPGFLRRLLVGHFEEVEGGSLYQKLDYFFLVRYRRWSGAVKNIYRRFFPVREPFVGRRVLDWSYAAPPAVKKAKAPHFRILRANFPALQYDLTNKMTPALPFGIRTFPRFIPSVAWRTKQVLRGFSRRYLGRELFPLADYVDYGSWIRTPSGRSLLEKILRPEEMRSGFLYEPSQFRDWLRAQREEGYPSFSLIDKIFTLELFFRDLDSR